MGRSVDYYFSPQSPWTYLGHERFARMAKTSGATVNLLPVDFGKVFAGSGGLPLGKRAPQRQAYRLVDLARHSKQLRLPLHLNPKYFPVAGDDAARLIIAVDRADGPDAAMRLCAAIFAAVWAQERDIADGAVLGQLLAECALDPSRTEEARSTAVQQHYESNTARAIETSVFGAPSYVVDGEIFWGQDRLDFVERALQSSTFTATGASGMGNFIDLKAADGFSFPAYVAQPAGKPKGGVVVLQEIFGVNSHIRAVADGYAAAGYLAVAPATFHRLKQGVELGYQAEDMQAGSELKAAVEALPAPGVLQDIQAAIQHASQAGKVGIVGYCWGGLLTWRAACLLDGLSAAAPYYGGGMTQPAESARHPKVPVMAHFGDQDTHIPMDTVGAFEKAHPEVEVHVYAAQHGFNCDQRGSWNAGAAATAKERTLDHFRRHLQ